jgi:tetratricopeptide (TPR) repeat protein
MAMRMANMRVAGTSALRPTNRSTKALPGSHVQFAAPTNSSHPTLPPFIRGTGTVPLLQTLLPPLKRAFDLPYASDTFLYSNGIIRYESMLIACADEVRFAEELRRGGHFNAAADVIDWLPKGNACCYVAGRLRVQRGDYDEAADLFERSGRSFGKDNLIQTHSYAHWFIIGPLAFRNETEVSALQAVLPKSLENLDSLSDYYQHIALLFEEQSQFQLAVPFYKLAIENAQSESAVTDLWYNVFRGQLLKEDFEDAYMSVVEMPNTM